VLNRGVAVIRAKSTLLLALARLPDSASRYDTGVIDR
jgi:hypothetical protein